MGTGTIDFMEFIEHMAAANAIIWTLAVRHAHVQKGGGPCLWTPSGHGMVRGAPPKSLKKRALILGRLLSGHRAVLVLPVQIRPTLRGAGSETAEALNLSCTTIA